MKRSTLSRAAAVPAALALTLGLAACGAVNERGTGGGAAPASDARTGLSGTIAGAGASSQAAAMEAWIAGFTSANGDATVNYDPVGSGGGREQFIAGGVQFAGTDAYLKPEEVAAAQQTCGGDFVELPLYVSPIAVIFNLEGIDSLNLSPQTIAQVFDRKITRWDDPAIAADNPGVDLPDTAITPVNRSDESGTTENFTEYLAAAAGDAWPHEPDGNWPVSGGEAAQGTSGVVGAVQGGQGTIGYADASQAGDLGAVAVGVGEEFVPFSPEAAAAVVEASPAAEGRGENQFAIDLARDTTADGAYPIVLVSYTLACTTYDSAEQADLVKGFLTYMASAEGQQAAQGAAGSAPITDGQREQYQTAIDRISAG